MGKELFEEVVTGTGLPDHWVRDEFSALLAKYGKTPETLTLDELRIIMADYMQDVFVEMLEKGNEHDPFVA